MKVNEILSQSSYVNILESKIKEPSIMLESAAEMVRTIRTAFSTDKQPKEFADFWTADNIVKFCAALERIESIVTKQITAKTLNTNLRDTVFSVLSTADFDESTIIARIIKQSNGQTNDLAKWQKIIDDKKQSIGPLDKLARDISALVSQLRSKGAQTITLKKTEEPDNKELAT